jgi:hypothetical protein
MGWFTHFDFPAVILALRFVQRFALAAGGRAWIRLGSRKKPEARKMLENGAESHQSAARFVGRILGFTY